MTKQTNAGSLDYQAMTTKLDGIMLKLQDENTSIDESIKLYEQGLELSQNLTKYLEQAKNKVTKLSGFSKG